MLKHCPNSKSLKGVTEVILFSFSNQRSPGGSAETEFKFYAYASNTYLDLLFKGMITVFLNPIALRMAKTLWSFGHSECNRVNMV